MNDDTSAPVDEVGPELPKVPLPPGYIPEQFAKSCDPTSPPPMRMMAARAMAPIPPKNLVPIIYQLLMDPDPKIAAAADKSFRNLDDKLLQPILSDYMLPQQILHALCLTLVDKFAPVEKVLLNKATPDEGFVFVAEHASDEKVINVVVENQERLLRNHDIVRSLGKNPKALRSDIDRAVDFLVREGVFLDDMAEFEDSFTRLGKAEMLAALKKVKFKEERFDEEDRRKAAALGLSPEEVLLGGDELSDDEVRRRFETEDHEEAAVDMGRGKKKWTEMDKIEKLKAAFQGAHEYAIEAIRSPNKALAFAGINNPSIRESDIPNIARLKTVHEDVIRCICNNGDWTKSYAVKFSLIQHPKTPPSLILRWMPLLRGSDLKLLAKSKQIPSAVAIQAKRILSSKPS